MNQRLGTILGTTAHAIDKLSNALILTRNTGTQAHLLPAFHSMLIVAEECRQALSDEHEARKAREANDD